MGVINKVVLDGTTHTIAASALAICDTAAASSAKVATVSGNQAFTLIEGTTIQVQFKYANEATNPTLNINGTGAKSIFCFGTEPITNDPNFSWQDGSIISFTYNGTGWVYNGYQVATGSGGGGAQRNSNWTATTGVTSILNKPSIPSTYSDVGALSANTTYVSSVNGMSGSVTLPGEYIKNGNLTLPISEIKTWDENGYDGLLITTEDETTSTDYFLYKAAAINSMFTTAAAKVSQVEAVIPQISAVTSSGVNIANVTVNGTTTHLYAPAGGGGMVQVDWNATSGINSILNKPNLATVATTGNYSDLNGQPEIPSIAVSTYLDEGTRIASITINNITKDLYAPAGGGGSQQNADWAADTGVTSILNKPNIPVVTASSNVTVGTEIGSITVDSATTTFYSDWMMVEATASWSAGELYGFNITNGYTNEDVDNYAETGKIHLKVTNTSWIDISGQGRWLPIGNTLIYNYSNSWLGHVFQAIQETTVKTYTLTGSGENYNWMYEESSLEGTNADWEATSGPSVILNKPSTFNPDYHASEDSEYGLGTANLYGHVALSDSYMSDASAGDGVAATPLAVSEVYNAIPQISVTSGQHLANQHFVGSITINDETTEFYAPNLTAITLSSFAQLTEDDLLTISGNFSQGLPVRVRHNTGFLDEENIDYLELVDVAGNNGDGVPSYLTFIGTTSTQIHRAHYDDTSSGLIKWTYSYTQIPVISTSTAAVSSGDRLLVQTVISAASSASGGLMPAFPDTYEIKTTSIEFGNSTTQFLANDGQWRTPAGGGGGSAGGTVNYNSGVLEIVFYNN